MRRSAQSMAAVWFSGGQNADQSKALGQWLVDQGLLKKLPW